jgi:alpha-aminoadipic semialdehyde synthase
MSRSHHTIGILREIKTQWERRVPLTPTGVLKLLQHNSSLRILIQPSTTRVYSDTEYQHVGASVTNDLSECNIILGVKEQHTTTMTTSTPTSISSLSLHHHPPPNLQIHTIPSLLSNKSYIMFSHTIKGQPSNIPLLDYCIHQNIRLFDYECIRHSITHHRLVAFGYYAGLAGVIDSLRGLGQRLLALGYSTPFLNIGSMYMYPTLEHAKTAVREAGQYLIKYGLPLQVTPLTVVVTGTGNVSRGACEVLGQVSNARSVASIHTDACDYAYGC